MAYVETVYGVEEVVLEDLAHSQVENPETAVHTGGVNAFLPANNFGHAVFERFKRFDRQVGGTLQVPQPHSPVVRSSRQHRLVLVVTKSLTNIY